MQVSKVIPINNKQNCSFKAIPRAKYLNAGNKVEVIQLEKQDVPFINNFLSNINSYFKKHKINDSAHKEIMLDSFNATKEILENSDKLKKSKVLLAVANKEPQGIIIANILKKGNDNKLHYSSRHNHASTETELDWIVTWNKYLPNKTKNIGKVLTTEYFMTLKKDKFKSVFVRSELPEKSCASNFYNKMGFEDITTKREKLEKHNSNKYIIKTLDNPQDEIIPMIIWGKKINETIKSNVKELERNSLPNISQNIFEILN